MTEGTKNATNQAFAYAQWSGSKRYGEKHRQLFWTAYLSATSDYSHTSSDQSETYNNWTPGAFLSVGIVPDDENGNAQLRLIYSRRTKNPTLAQLGENPQWFDSKLAHRGNSALKSYAENRLYLMANASLWKRADISLTAFYENSPHMITELFIRDGDFISQTFENLKCYQQVYGSLQLSIMLARNGSLRFTSLLNASRSWGKGRDYSWKGYTFQWMPALIFNSGKWLASAMYQYPGKVSVGHLSLPRAQCLRLYAGFSPLKNLDITFEWMQPFNMSFRESEMSAKEAIVNTGKYTMPITCSTDCHFTFIIISVSVGDTTTPSKKSSLNPQTRESFQNSIYLDLRDARTIVGCMCRFKWLNLH